METIIDTNQNESISYKLFPEGTKVQTTNGPAILQKGEVFVIDANGKPYVTTAGELLRGCKGFSTEGFTELYALDKVAGQLHQYPNGLVSRLPESLQQEAADYLYELELEGNGTRSSYNNATIQKLLSNSDNLETVINAELESNPQGLLSKLPESLRGDAAKYIIEQPTTTNPNLITHKDFCALEKLLNDKGITLIKVEEGYKTEWWTNIVGYKENGVTYKTPSFRVNSDFPCDIDEEGRIQAIEYFLQIFLGK